MTEFQALNHSAMAESIAVTGATLFRLRALEYSGSLTDLTEDEKFEMGQVIPGVAATLEFARVDFVPPLRNGERVSFSRDGKARTMRVGRVTMDEVSIVLALQDTNA